MKSYKIIYNDIKNQLSFYYNESFNFERPTSNNNFIFEALMSNLNDLIAYYNSDLLCAFNDELKPHNKEKLQNWLKDEDPLFLFESDFIVNRACQYYASQDEFIQYYINEFELELSIENYDFNMLTEDERDKLETDLNCYIPKNEPKRFYGLGGTGFALKLPKRAILREYMDYIRSNR